MEKCEIPTLPPLVHGKLAGSLEIFINNVEIAEKAILRHKNCSFAVQILWWGETKSFLVRPKRFQFVREGNEQISLYEQGSNSLKYEIRTKLRLFKSYLTMCEVLELTVFDTVHNEVVGSAFLKDLVHLVFSTEVSSSCIINDFGDPIGEITCHFLFNEVNSSGSALKGSQKVDDQKKGEVVSNHLTENILKINLSELYSPEEKTWNENEPYRIPDDVKSREDLISVSTSNQVFSLSASEAQLVPQSTPGHKIDSSWSSKGQEFHSNEGLECKKATERDPDLSLKGYELHDTSEHSNTNDTVEFAKKFPAIIDPNDDSSHVICHDIKEKKKLNNTSKVKKSNIQNRDLRQENTLKGKDQIWKCFKHPVKVTNNTASVNKMKTSTEKKLSKSRATSADRTATVRKTKKIKSCDVTNVENPKNVTRLCKYERPRTPLVKSHMKATNNSKTFEKISNEISKLNKMLLNPKKTLRDNDSDLEKIPVKENGTGRVQEQAAIETTKKQESGVKTFPKRICEQHPNSNKNSCSENPLPQVKRGALRGLQERPTTGTTTLDKVNVNNKLIFDLSIPIERIYYETFFSKGDKLGEEEFEVTELLNQASAKSYSDKPSNITECVNEYIPDQNKDIWPTKSRDEATQYRRNSFGDESDVLSKITEERDSLDLKVEEECFNRNESDCFEYAACEMGKDTSSKLKAQLEEKADCHRCKYYKKLSELDRIIEALKDFESSLKTEVIRDGRTTGAGDLSVGVHVEDDILNENTSMSRHLNDSSDLNENFDVEEEVADRGDFSVDIGYNESDYSKEDSDFIEFTHYMSKR